MGVHDWIAGVNQQLAPSGVPRCLTSCRLVYLSSHACAHALTTELAMGSKLGSSAVLCPSAYECSLWSGGHVLMPGVCAGKGAVYTYDPVGSYERTGYSCQARPHGPCLAHRSGRCSCGTRPSEGSGQAQAHLLHALPSLLPSWDHARAGSVFCTKDQPEQVTRTHAQVRRRHPAGVLGAVSREQHAVQGSGSKPETWSPQGELACWVQGTGKDLIQPVLDNQLAASSPLVLPPQVGPHPQGLPSGDSGLRRCCACSERAGWPQRLACPACVSCSRRADWDQAATRLQDGCDESGHVQRPRCFWPREALTWLCTSDPAPAGSDRGGTVQCCESVALHSAGEGGCRTG